MISGSEAVRAPGAHSAGCRLVVRREKGLNEILQFVIAGLEVGQQVVAMAGAPCLKDLACSLSDSGLRPDILLRSGRLIFLTTPDCLSRIVKSDCPFERTPLHRNGSVLRWLSDWSWAYANGPEPRAILNDQRRIHHFVRAITPLSLCTVHCERLGRSSLLAMLADHRRATRAIEPSAKVSSCPSLPYGPS